MKELVVNGVTFVVTEQTYEQMVYDLESDRYDKDYDRLEEHFYYRSILSKLEKELREHWDVEKWDLYSDVHKDCYGFRPSGIPVLD